MTVAQGAAAAEPLRLLTTTQMRRAERIAMAEGVLGLSLMEAAGRAVAESVQRRFPPCSVLVVCGPGANGGDGFVVARRLAEAGFAVRVATIGDTAKRPPDAETMAQKWSGPAPAWSPSDLEDAALIVDGVFGAGLARPLSGAAAAFAEAANRTTARVVSIDAPSGLNADSGQVDGVCVQADLTVTFARKRPGHLLPPGRDLSGEVEAADIGVSDAAIAKAVADASDPIAPDLFENGPGLWRRAVAAPMRSAHKYARGHLGCLCGPAHRTGAARLAARSGLRIGAGAATLLCPPEAVPIVAAHETAVMIEPIADTEAMTAWAQQRRAAALVLGPAAGVGAATRELVEAALQLRVPCVLDADALTSFEDVSADLFGAIRKAAAPVALTPHAGEFARLFPSIDVASEGRIAAAARASSLSGALVVFKGPDTIVADGAGRAAINASAPPTLATAGSGDVLAGMIGGLLAQGSSAFEATCAAVWLHGVAAAHFGPGLIAEDLPDLIPGALRAL